MAPEDDPLLLARARAGDAGAFSQLVLLHQSRVRQQLRRLCHGDTALADDLAQDAFVQAWQALPGFRGDSRLATWLYRIAYLRYLMHARSAQRSPVRGAADDDLVPLEPAAPAGSPALRIDLARALARLSEPQRLALIHCHALDLAHDEAAAVLGWPLGTLKSHLARGKARLRELMADWQPLAAGPAGPEILP